MLFLFQSALAQSPVFEISSFKVEGNTLLDEATIQNVLAPYTGSGREMVDINKAAETLSKAYRSAGHAIVQVFPPVQTVSSGVFTLRVLEGKIKHSKVAGNTAYDANLRDSQPHQLEESNTNVNKRQVAIASAPEIPARRAAVSFDISTFRVVGNTLLDEAAIQNVLAPYTGSGREMADIDRAAEALTKAYRSMGYAIVQVFPPEQTVGSGTFILKVVEGKIKSVNVAGNQAYDAANVRSSLPHLSEGSKPNVNQLEAEIALANENPAKQVAVNFRPGENSGAIEAIVNVTEERSSKFFMSLDNTGNSSTGYSRLGLGYQNANLFNLDHVLTMQYLTSPDHSKEVKAINTGYRIPFYRQGLMLDLVAAYSDTSVNNMAAGSTGATLDFSGKGYVLAARLSQALPNVGNVQHKLIFGLDLKDFDNNCSLNGAATACGTVTTQPASLTYLAHLAHSSYQTSGSISYVANVVGGTHGSEAEYAAARAGATSSWNAWRLNGTLGIPLAGDWMLRSNLNAQLASAILVPGEQFGAGGTASVRGYPERAAAGDKGAGANFEIYTPELGKLLSFDDANLRLLFFYDLASVSRNGALLANQQRREQLSSIGFGLRFNYRKDVNIKLDSGWVQQGVATSDTPPRTIRDKHDFRSHLSLSNVF